jgi:hypothetical protein
MKASKNLRELKAHFTRIKNVVSDDTRFMADAMLFMINQNEKLLKKKEPSSDASVFISYKIRFENMGFIDALKAWKEIEKQRKAEN